jgi:multidrug efflux pump subunit AcrA (membrane-fusion protein)
LLGTGGERFVFVEEGDKYIRTPVATGIENDKWIEVVEGLAPGDVVVTQGNYQLQFAKRAERLPAVKPGADPAKTPGK